MGSSLNTKQLLSAVARLTGPAVRKATHGHIFRIEVESSDGKRCAVSVGPISDHRKEPSSATIICAVTPLSS